MYAVWQNVLELNSGFCCVASKLLNQKTEIQSGRKRFGRELQHINAAFRGLLGERTGPIRGQGLDTHSIVAKFDLLLEQHSEIPPAKFSEDAYLKTKMNEVP